ncbi:unnamed protein product [Rotaria sp. Silwood1]|nr:unnamed protein product [Rotaria sp. Silwood1]CAF4659245.1 unnamed protein product [Rotaria sp. Silwood1]CAF4674758.1 unnamed protein product [Rotaria sp. Silwood1]CAF4712052.1 unnamed protein product [Rotaria sp. Silwood1]
MHHISLFQLLNENEVSLLYLDSIYISIYLIHLISIDPIYVVSIDPIRFISIDLMIVVGKRLVSYETRSLTTSVELCFTCESVLISLDVKKTGGEDRNIQLRYGLVMVRRSASG